MTTGLITITTDRHGQFFASTAVHGLDYTAGPNFTEAGALEGLRNRIELQMRVIEREIQYDPLGMTAHEKLRLFSLGEVVAEIDSQLDKLVARKKVKG